MADCAFAIERFTERIDDATEQRVADRHRHRPAGGAQNAGGGNAGEMSVRHQQRAFLTEADDFSLERRASLVLRFDLAQFAQPRFRSDRLDHQTVVRHDPSELPTGRHPLDVGDEAFGEGFHARVCLASECLASSATSSSDASNCVFSASIRCARLMSYKPLALSIRH